MRPIIELDHATIAGNEEDDSGPATPRYPELAMAWAKVMCEYSERDMKRTKSGLRLKITE